MGLNMDMPAPTERTPEQQSVMTEVMVKFDAALARFFDQIHTTGTRNGWSEDLMATAIEHHCGIEVLEAWDEWVAEDAPVVVGDTG